MKLLFITPYFYPKTGGVENYLWNIALGLHNTYRNEIVIVTSNHLSNTNTKEIIRGLTIYRLKTDFKISNTPVGIKWYKQILKIIKEEKPDIINGHTPVPFISDIGAKVAKKLNIPYVLTYQNDLVKENIFLQFIINAYYYLLGNKTGDLSKNIIISSAYYMKISSYLKPFKSKIAVISPGVEMDLYESTEPSRIQKKKYKGEKVVLFVGQLDRTHMHKGLHLLIEAISQVEKMIKNVKLVVIGKGDMIDEYKEIASKQGIGKKFEIISDADNKKLISYYKLADVTILPSINKSEGFGMVLLESNACKTPVIGSKIGGIPFVIQNNKTGLLVEPGDVSALKTAMIKLLTDKTFSEALGKTGFARVKKDFTWDIQCKKTHQLFKSLL